MSFSSMKRPLPPTTNKIAKLQAPQTAIVAKPKTRLKSVKRVVKRVWPLNLTGFYESVPEKGKDSAILLQLNQVGHMLVGWLTPPPDFVIGNRSTIKSLPPNEGKFAMKISVFFAFLDVSPERGGTFYWFKATPPSEKNKGNLLERYTLDPLDILLAERRITNQGFFKPIVQFNECVSILLVLDDSRQDKNLNSNSPHTDRLVRVSDRARISNFTGYWLPEPMQKMLLVKQFCPIPMSYMDRARAVVAPFDNPKDEPKLASLLRKWRQAAHKSEKQVARAMIGNELGNASPRIQPTSDYLTLFQTNIRGHMKSADLIIEKEKKSYYDWVVDVLAQELDEDDEWAMLGKGSRLPSTLQKKCKELGISTLGKYCYTLSFTETHVPVLKLLQTANRLKDTVLFGFHIGGASFSVTIKKEIVTYAETSDGRFLYKDNKPVVKTRKFVWDSARMKGGTLSGVFGDFGVGLSLTTNGDSLLGTNKEPTTDPSLKVKGKSSGSGAVNKVEFFSNISLDSPKAFAYAMFTIAGLSGPGVSYGNFGKFDLFKSKLIEFHLTNHVNLSTVQEVIAKGSGPKYPSGSLKLDPIGVWEGWHKPKIGVRLFDLSGAFGWLLDADGIADIKKKANEPIPDQPPLSDNTRVTTEAFFQVDSADMDSGTMGNDFTPRVILEALLASEKAVFEKGNATIQITGYTSPEGTKSHNLDLSERRAEAVAQAIRDAFGTAVSFHDIKPPIGRGEQPALDNGLTNPPFPIGNWKTKHPDQVKEWPNWRRVDIWVDGVLVISMRESNISLFEW